MFVVAFLISLPSILQRLCWWLYFWVNPRIYYWSVQCLLLFVLLFPLDCKSKWTFCMPEMLAHTRLHTHRNNNHNSWRHFICPLNTPFISPSFIMDSTWATAQFRLGLGFFLHLWLHLLFNFDCCCCCCCCCTPFSIFKWSQFLMSWQDTQRIPKRIRIRMRMCLKVKLSAQRTTIKNARRSRVRWGVGGQRGTLIPPRPFCDFEFFSGLLFQQQQQHLSLPPCLPLPSFLSIPLDVPA